MIVSRAGGRTGWSVGVLVLMRGAGFDVDAFVGGRRGGGGGRRAMRVLVLMWAVSLDVDAFVGRCIVPFTTMLRIMVSSRRLIHRKVPRLMHRLPPPRLLPSPKLMQLAIFMIVILPPHWARRGSVSWLCCARTHSIPPTLPPSSSSPFRQHDPRGSSPRHPLEGAGAGIDVVLIDVEGVVEGRFGGGEVVGVRLRAGSVVADDVDAAAGELGLDEEGEGEAGAHFAG